MTPIPQYAQKANPARLLHILCRDCGKNVMGELDQDYPGKEALKKAEMFQYGAKCLRCGYVARDNYNWYR